MRSLAQLAGFVDENDFPELLMMYSVGASMLRCIQEPYRRNEIKQGYKYLICDIGGTKVKMNLYETKEPLDANSNILSERQCNWDTNYMKKPCQLFVGAQDIRKLLEIHALSLLRKTRTDLSTRDEIVGFMKLVDDIF